MKKCSDLVSQNAHNVEWNWEVNFTNGRTKSFVVGAVNVPIEWVVKKVEAVVTKCVDYG